MGQQDNNISENPDNGELKATQTVLSAMTAELENLKQNLISQMNQELKQLQDEKSRLRQEIDHLEQERQQQMAQQQQIAKQLAQALASQLQEQLTQQLNQMPSNTQATEHNENTYKLIASLDSTLRTTFKTLQQDLNSYQSSLSQQLSHMHSLEQQGEAILEALVNRLSEQIQRGSQQVPTEPYNPTLSDLHQDVPLSPSAATQQLAEVTTPSTSVPLTAPPKPAPRKEGLSPVQTGFILVLLSTVALSVHNVIVGIIGFPSSILGRFPTGGFINITHIGNSLLVLWIRMMSVLPLLAIVAKALYPPVWTDLRKVLLARDRRPLLMAIASGFSLFLSQVLIYIAIGQIGPGVAVTILFMYPIITVPLAWILFGDRPTSVRIGAMLTIALGVILAAWPRIFASTNTVSWLGVGIAVLSGVAFAFYLIFIGIAFQERVAPVPASLIQFATIFVLCSLSLMLPVDLGVQVLASKQQGLLIGGMILGVLTLLGYLLNNFAIRSMGAARASIVSSIGPAMTAIMAMLIVPSPKNFLQGVQVAGILLVTLAVAALSLEKLKVRSKPPSPTR